MRRATIPLFLAAGLTALAGCGLRQVQPGFTGLPAQVSSKNFDCCHDPERYPEAFADAALAVAQATLAHLPFDAGSHPSLLAGNAAAVGEIARRARPLDIVLMANKSYFGGRLVPGRFTHSAAYLGTEPQLRALGLWDSPAIVPLQDDIRAGRVFVEAIRPRVKLSTLAELMRTDAIVLIRPELGPAARKRAAVTLVSKLGVPFDFWFDNRTPDVLACTELLGLAMPELGFTIRAPYGRPAAMPDDVVAQAIRGERMQLIAQVRGLPGGGHVVEGREGAMRDIAAFWGPPYSR